RPPRAPPFPYTPLFRPAHDQEGSMPSTSPDAPGSGAPGTPHPPVLALLRTSLPTLPPQLQRLAVLALESPAEVGRMTITEYAERERKSTRLNSSHVKIS